MKCQNCNGTGHKRCFSCGGNGTRIQMMPMGRIVMPLSLICFECSGTGKKICYNCGGKGESKY